MLPPAHHTIRQVAIWMLVGGLSIAVARAIVSMFIFLLMKGPGAEASEVFFIFAVDLPTNLSCAFLSGLGVLGTDGPSSPLTPSYFVVGETIWFILGAACAALAWLNRRVIV